MSMCAADPVGRFNKRETQSNGTDYSISQESFDAADALLAEVVANVTERELATV
jgi:hypothetical protein